MRTRGVTAVLVLCLAAAPARAQQQQQEQPQQQQGPVPVPDAPLIAPGTYVRVKVDGVGSLTRGHVLTSSDTQLLLRATDGTTRDVPLEALRRVEVRGRRTKAGAITGALVLLVPSYLVAVACNSNDADSGPCAGLRPVMIGVGLGAVVGGLIGHVIPYWKDAYVSARPRKPVRVWVEELPVVPPPGAPRPPTPKAPPSRAPAPAAAETGKPKEGASKLGSMALQLGYATRVDGERTPGERGPGVRLQLLARLGRHLAAGPDLAYHPVPSTRATYVDPWNGQEYRYDLSRRFVQLGGVVRAGASEGTVRPAGLLGTHLTFVSGGNIPSVSAGGELEVHLGRRVPAVVLDLRVHQTLREHHGAHTWVTAGVGARLAW